LPTPLLKKKGKPSKRQKDPRSGKKPWFSSLKGEKVLTGAGEGKEGGGPCDPSGGFWLASGKKRVGLGKGTTKKPFGIDMHAGKARLKERGRRRQSRGKKENLGEGTCAAELLPCKKAIKKKGTKTRVGGWLEGERFHLRRESRRYPKKKPSFESSGEENK